MDTIRTIKEFFMGHKKPKTLSPDKAKEVTAYDEEQLEDTEAIELAIPRPKNRSECVDGPRPCPFISCRYHLYLDVSKRTGSIKLNFPDKEPWELEETCSLDLSEKGGLPLEIISKHMNLTRERVRQIEEGAIVKMKKVASKEDL